MSVSVVELRKAGLVEVAEAIESLVEDKHALIDCLRAFVAGRNSERLIEVSQNLIQEWNDKLEGLNNGAGGSAEKTDAPRMRIVGGPVGGNTQILMPDGTPINNVSKLTITVTPEGQNTATLEIFNFDLDLEADPVTAT